MIFISKFIEINLIVLMTHKLCGLVKVQFLICKVSSELIYDMINKCEYNNFVVK